MAIGLYLLTMCTCGFVGLNYRLDTLVKTNQDTLYNQRFFKKVSCETGQIFSPDGQGSVKTVPHVAGDMWDLCLTPLCSLCLINSHLPTPFSNTISASGQLLQRCGSMLVWAGINSDLSWFLQFLAE